MGKVSSFRLSGIECWFYSHDHRPPHFHAKRRGEWEVRVYFLRARREMIEVKWLARGARFLRGNEICELAEQFRSELLEEYELKVRCDDAEED